MGLGDLGENIRLRYVTNQLGEITIKVTRTR